MVHNVISGKVARRAKKKANASQTVVKITALTETSPDFFSTKNGFSVHS